jgi:hypothetical protein
VVVLALVAVLMLFASSVLMKYYRGAPVYLLEQPPVCPTRPGVPLEELLTEATVLDYEVRIVEVVALDDEVVVGTSHGTIHLHLPWPFARQQALDRLHWWRMAGTRLVAFHAPSHGLAGVADEDTGHFLCTPAGA